MTNQELTSPRGLSDQQYVEGDEPIYPAPAMSDGSQDQSSGVAGVGITDEAIRRKAYELYIARRGMDGNAEEDWREAERRLRQEGSAPPPAI